MVQINAEVVKKSLLRRLKYVFKKSTCILNTAVIIRTLFLM
jgi:hypothetical protein